MQRKYCCQKLWRISIFPNPSNGNFILSFNGYNETDISFEIIDFTGKQIFSEQNAGRTVKINITNYPNGAYLVKFFVNNKIYTEKIIKNE